MTSSDRSLGKVNAMFPSELPRMGQVAQYSNRVLKLTLQKILV